MTLFNQILLPVEATIQYPEEMDPMGKDFVSKLLLHDPKQRLNGKALMIHPFIYGIEEKQNHHYP